MRSAANASTIGLANVARGHGETGAEIAVEMRQVAEAACQRDIGDGHGVEPPAQQHAMRTMEAALAEEFGRRGAVAFEESLNAARAHSETRCQQLRREIA